MSIYLIWFLIGVGFLIAEFIIPTFILFFFALGSFVVSIVTAGIDLSVNSQIILFATSSVTSLLLLRNYLKNIFRGNQSSGKDNYFEDSNEDIAFVTKNIDSNSFGEIKYKGTFYRAQSKNKIKEGETVKVLGKGDEQGSFFIVDKLS
tara:strand:+ start:195 stop:638 length:444 start_codon:yes stop_codon:yes gene_type:complete